jgi:hypothetical protein
MHYRIAAVAAAIALTIAACGDASDDAGIATLETTTTAAAAESTTTDVLRDNEEALLEFTECLRENGVEIDDPTVGADGSLQLAPIEIEVEVDDPESLPEGPPPELDAAFSACEPLLEGVTQLGAGIPDETAFEDTFLEYAGCMREHGVDMPDPDFSGSGGMIDLGTMDPTDPDWMAADEACREILARIGLPGF